MELGVLAASPDPAELRQLLETARQVGFDAAQVWARYGPDEAGWAEVLGTLRRLGIRLAAAGGYTNPLDPDPARREAGLADLRRAIARAAAAGAPIVVTWSGTRAPGMFEPHPDNASQAAFDEAVAIFRDVARTAEAAGVTVAIEPYIAHVASTPERLRDLVDAVGSPRLRAVMDPPNFITPEALETVNEAMPRMFAILGDRIALVHCKDIRAPRPGDTRAPLNGVVLPEPGGGILDYARYADLIRRHYDGDVIVEHITLATMGPARAFVARHLGLA